MDAAEGAVQGSLSDQLMLESTAEGKTVEDCKSLQPRFDRATVMITQKSAQPGSTNRLL